MFICNHYNVCLYYGTFQHVVYEQILAATISKTMSFEINKFQMGINGLPETIYNNI